MSIREKNQLWKSNKWLIIPNNINISLAICLPTVLMVLIYYFDRSTSIQVSAFYLFLFSLLFLSNFSLMHEAGHKKAHEDSTINYLIGLITGTIFLAPFSLHASMHWNHHLRNRTHFENFDLIKENEPIIKKYAIWYGFLLGFWYWMIPLGSCLIVCMPQKVREKILKVENRVANFDAYDLDFNLVKRCRLEVALIFSYLVFLHYYFEVTLHSLFLIYFLGGVWWSTLQYIEHAYTPLDVYTGAFNLRASKLFSYFTLHKELDLNHHLYPAVSWIHLPSMPIQQEKSYSFWRHYWLQWLGPIHGSFNSPKVVDKIESDYSKLDSIQHFQFTSLREQSKF